MGFRAGALDSRLDEQSKKKNKPIIDDEPDDMDILLDHEIMTALNKQKSIFDTQSGNNTPGINTMPSVFERTAIFHTET